jgi:hypothetical protein
MHTIETLIKELLVDSPSLKAVLMVTAMLEEQRDELIEKVKRMSKQSQPRPLRSNRPILKISKIVDEVTVYTGK